MIGTRRPKLAIGRPYGSCPVQSEGVVDGKDYYFRSRGNSWSLSIGGDDEISAPEWFYEEDFGTWPDAGYITDDQAHEFIGKAVGLYRSGVPTMLKSD